MSFTKLFKETMKKVAAKKVTPDIDFRKIRNQKLMNYRKEKSSVVRLDGPSNPIRARELGYSAKSGVFVVRSRVRRGGGLFGPVHKARRPKRHGFKKLTRRISIQRIAEIRASTKHSNAEVINSYLVGEDGLNKYYEVILADRASPNVMSSSNLSRMVTIRGRAERGITSAGKKNRGLDKKGKGTENIRPSIRANKRHGK